MAFAFGPKSQATIAQLHPDLREVLVLALSLASQDFAVVQGLRTLAQEQACVADGASTTMHSRHLTGHAADCAPCEASGVAFDWPHIYPVFQAIRLAAIRLGIPMTWGAVWDRDIRDLTDDLEAEAAAYVARRRAAGLRVFQDGDHIELAWAAYPA